MQVQAKLPKAHHPIRMTHQRSSGSQHRHPMGLTPEQMAYAHMGQKRADYQIQQSYYEAEHQAKAPKHQAHR